MDPTTIAYLEQIFNKIDKLAKEAEHTEYEFYRLLKKEKGK